jgi:hypothetical protein
MLQARSPFRACTTGTSFPAVSQERCGLVMLATLTRRLDRITRQMERLERDVGISVETVALFVRFWLMGTPSPPELAQAAATKGAERYENCCPGLCVPFRGASLRHARS